jgi:hypothetical protein
LKLIFEIDIDIEIDIANSCHSLEIKTLLIFFIKISTKKSPII